LSLNLQVRRGKRERKERRNERILKYQILVMEIKDLVYIINNRKINCNILNIK